MEESTNFIVSARKYRPQTFDDVVGQYHITSTLRNAIRNNKIAHAMLFCGSRGVGKTTCARIMAKTLNCLKPTSAIDPCNKCDSCRAFNESHSFNIHELDAASNNKVEDIRNLIEQVRIPPQLGRYSIFIIDEVHMLTSQAFNAFLKTLEEPPPHAIFILATTEKHKILPTILSRCQIFDFHRISVDDMANHLARIAVKEGVEAEPDALHIIAQKADGALRDALSIFDRIVTFAGNRITYKDVIDNLTILDYDYFFKVTDLAIDGNHTELLLLFNNVLMNGFDGQHFLSGLADHLRNLLIAKEGPALALLEVGESIRQRYITQAATCQPDFIIQALLMVNKVEMDYRAAQNKRLQVEICLLQLAGLKKKRTN